MRILVGVNVLQQVSAEVYGNHCQWWFNLGRQRPKDEFILYSPRRVSIDNMRNEAARQALLMECDYLMFIDDDVIIPMNTLDSLLDANKDIVMALTYLRTYPFRPMFFKEIERRGNQSIIDHWIDFEKDVPESGVLDCHSIGFSCALIKCDLLKKVSTPYFVTSRWHTEDVYFCMKAKQELGYDNVSIAVDTRVPTGHLMDQDMITVDNYNALRNYFESFHKLEDPRKGEEVLQGDRDFKYIQRSLKEIDKKYTKEEGLKVNEQ